MTEIYSSIVMEIGLHLIPIALVIFDLFTVWTNRDDVAQGFHFLRCFIPGFFQLFDKWIGDPHKQVGAQADEQHSNQSRN